ncbi:NFACT RNA binding domain-containing protein [Echinicola rosea]|uniref:Fibronectin-binding protein A n=1 Tax=Echinicola rosea TaxID=1807691 RepID=A0ABQ1UE91_9BACT|nr:NFACT RNA binding domain-containing protein [Echinicola rosea]GGF17049.1 fibronectin-binding protein A [Echinicola rosea]
MHLNYHFLKYLCPELETTFAGLELVTCFSQHKDELVMGFADDEQSHYLRANLSPSNPCICFPEDYKRSKKNSVDLFPELIGDTVVSVRALSFERAFRFDFKSQKTLLFKLHGSRSNILLYSYGDHQHPKALFRNELKEDHNIALHELERHLDLSYEEFLKLEGKAAAFLPTLGKIPREWLKSHGYIEADIETKWQLMQEMLDMLNAPLFSIIKKNDQYQLTLLPVQNAIFSSADPTESCNAYFQHAVIHQAFEKEKGLLVKKLEDQKKKTNTYLNKTSNKLAELQDSPPPSQTADVIMANLHQIPQGAETTTLFDFYQNKETIIKLKKGLTPQKYAENLYRKSKNRKLEIQQLQKNLSEKEDYYLQLETLLEELAPIDNFKELRAFSKTHQLSTKPKEDQTNLPFKRFEIDDFEILVGKSAKSNDQMLRYYSWKDDVWLHAKDVAGSHVIIKYKSGQPIPQTTLERAAELAAYYSKSKNESLAAVIYTPCKYVRKVKGSPAGAVMVDQEKVLMVAPKGPVSS